MASTGKDWSGVAGWARMKAGVLEKLGCDAGSKANPCGIRRVTAVGPGAGLEGLAMLRYGMNDVREVMAETVPTP